MKSEAYIHDLEKDNIYLQQQVEDLRDVLTTKPPQKYITRDAILNLVIEQNGRKYQFDMAIEEAAEYIQAINKFHRKPCDIRLTALHEEIADVQITLDQVKIMTGYNERTEDEKLAKLLAEMEG